MYIFSLVPAVILKTKNTEELSEIPDFIRGNKLPKKVRIFNIV